jgi:hypothetical protein
MKPKRKGLRLLKEWLSPEQLAQYDAHNYFDVTGCHSGKRYRICHGRAANICELDYAGQSRVGWCFIPKDRLVPGDVMLVQKIALETDEGKSDAQIAAQIGGAEKQIAAQRERLLAKLVDIDAEIRRQVASLVAGWHPQNARHDKAPQRRRLDSPGRNPTVPIQL